MKQRIATAGICISLCCSMFAGPANAQTAADQMTKGKKCFESNDMKGALSAFEAAVKLDPNNTTCYQYRGIVKFNTDDFEGAKKDFDVVLKAKPENSDIRYNRAVCRYSTNDAAGAMLDLNEVIRIDPENGPARFDRGRLLCTSKNPTELQTAIDDLTVAIRLKVKPDKAYNNRAIANASIGELNEAVYDGGDAIKANPRNTNALYNLCVNAFEMGDYVSADSALAKYLALCPKETDIYLKIGKTLYGRGLTYDSARLLEHIIKVDPTSDNAASAWLYIGHSYLFERKTESEKAYRQAVALDPKRMAAISCLAFNLRQQGKFDEAREPFERATAMAKERGKLDLLAEDLAQFEAKKTEPTPLFSGSYKSEIPTKKGYKPANLDIEYLNNDVYKVKLTSEDTKEKIEGVGVRTYENYLAVAYETPGNLEVFLMGTADKAYSSVSTGTTTPGKVKQKWLRLPETNMLAPTYQQPEANFCGVYDITGDAAPGGKKYKGKLTITKISETYNCKWDIEGGAKYEGPGLISGYFLACAFKSASNKPSVIMYSANLSGDLRGVWVSPGMAAPLVQTGVKLPLVETVHRVLRPPSK